MAYDLQDSYADLQVLQEPCSVDIRDEGVQAQFIALHGHQVTICYDDLQCLAQLLREAHHRHGRVVLFPPLASSPYTCKSHLNYHLEAPVAPFSDKPNLPCT